MDPDSLAGQQLGDYRLISRLGEGKAGVVYLATAVKAKPFADAGALLTVKVYKPEILKEPNQAERIKREAEVGSQLGHPNLVRIYEHYVGLYHPPQKHPDSAYLVMEYIDGVPLDAWLSMFHPIPDGFLIRILLQLADGLRELHDHGVIHRDLKPANIMISSTLNPKIMDFGVAAITSTSEKLTPGEKFLGTIRNASPELLRGEEVNERTDLYSLGTVFYALLKGEEIFAHEGQFVRLLELKQHSEPAFDPAWNNQPVSRKVADLSKLLLQNDQHKRMSSAKELLDALNEVRSLVQTDSLAEPLHGYLASALTGLDADAREAIIFVGSKIAEVCKRYGIFVYQPRKATDPVVNANIEASSVYLLDRSRVVNADLLFILANHPSIGLGQELEIASSHATPTWLITRQDTTISRMVTGSFANFLDQIVYTTTEDLDRALSNSLLDNLDRLRTLKSAHNSSAMPQLGSRLAARREELGITLEGAATKLGISVRMLGAIESINYENLSMVLLTRLCKLYQIEAATVLLSSGTPMPAVAPDQNVRRLELVARKMNWTAMDFFDLREDYLQELAASGSGAIVSDNEWLKRHGALEQKRLTALTAPVEEHPQGKLL